MKKKLKSNWRIRTAQLGKHQNTWRKRKWQVPGNIKSETIKQTEMKEKVEKEYLRTKTSWY